METLFKTRSVLFNVFIVFAEIIRSEVEIESSVSSFNLRFPK